MERVGTDLPHYPEVSNQEGSKAVDAVGVICIPRNMAVEVHDGLRDLRLEFIVQALYPFRINDVPALEQSSEHVVRQADPFH